MNMPTSADLFKRLLVIALATFILTTSSLEFYNITWGTGVWLGQFSFKWAAAFFLFILFCLACLFGTILVLWRNEKLFNLLRRGAGLRGRFGIVRWVIAALILFAPVWLLQYTPWGLIMDGLYLRLLMWMISAGLLGFLLTSTADEPLSWNGFLSGLVLISGTITFILSLGNVTSYPFSLGWSEGNRWWDYSILFGRDIYIYPSDKPIWVLLDIGRQFIGGIPFLLPGVTIWQARLWMGLVNVVPYLILGLVAFKSPTGSRAAWILAAIWAMIFVVQGPIHPPLLLCAIFVAFAWRKPLWLAIPMIMIVSYFAQISRYTWLFAPGMWAATLELSGAALHDGRLNRTAWVRAISVGLAGVLGGYVAPFFVPSLIAQIGSWWGGSSAEVVSSLGTGVTLASVSSEASSQPLLWYRLFPNATYGYGILLGLFLATAPLIAVLVYLSVTRRWIVNLWQKLAILLSLAAFFIVGLIISVKIGGGGDLHNMDMFIIGLLFAGTIAWHNAGRDWITRSIPSPAWARLALVFMAVIPAHQAVRFLRPDRVAEEDMIWVMTLADIPPQGPLPELLPYERDANKALEDIRRAVDEAVPHGEILFMDQRQLLAFGYITGVPLVPEYDKKVLINQAMSADDVYFRAFYRDLAAKRFSLIITNPLHERVQTEEDNFGEENNAWVEWVSTPVLCFYEPVDTLRKVRIQLLVPREDISACSRYLEE
jgi:hypothetical protein